MTGGPVLVLGGSGYLGRHICAAFASAGATVVRVSRQGGHDTDGLRTVSLDLTTAGAGDLARLCADTGARVLVNSAGVVWGGTERQMLELNADFVHRLAEGVAGMPRPPRLIQLGTAYEYGAAPPGEAIDEDWPLAPATPYGRTKSIGSQAVLRAVGEQGIDGVVLRVSVACGPGAPRASLPGLVAEYLVGDRAELCLAPLRAHRDLVDVRDVADAVVAAARAPASVVTGKVFNIGRGVTVPVRRMVDLLIFYSGRSLRVVEDRVEQNGRSDVPWLRLDIARARRLLGWAPRRSLEDSLRDLLADAGGRRKGRDERTGRTHS